MTEAQIIKEFDDLWSAAMKRPEGPNVNAIVAQVAASAGVRQSQVRRVVLDNNFAEPL